MWELKNSLLDLLLGTTSEHLSSPYIFGKTLHLALDSFSWCKHLSISNTKQFIFSTQYMIVFNKLVNCQLSICMDRIVDDDAIKTNENTMKYMHLVNYVNMQIHSSHIFKKSNRYPVRPIFHCWDELTILELEKSVPAK